MTWPRSLYRGVSVAATATAIGILCGSIGCGHTSHQACKGASEPPKQEWVVDGSIATVVAVCGAIYVGGSFNSIGHPTGAAVLVDARYGRGLPFPVVDGDVRVAVDDGRGGWFVGGDLKTVAGKPCHALAHVAGDMLDWCPLRGGVVSALARDGRDLYVAYSAGIEPPWGAPWRLASFDIGTRQRRAWAPALGTRRSCYEDACGPASYVYALVARRGVVYVGGTFSSVSHRPLHDLVAVDGATGRPLSFDAALATNDRRRAPFVTALALAGNVLYVAGGFSRIGGLPRANIAAVDASGGAATPWAPRVGRGTGTQPLVSAIAVTRNRVALGGSFRRVNGSRRRGFALVSASSATLLRPQALQAQRPDVGVVALAANDADVYVSGDGLNAKGYESTYSAAVDARTGRPSSWNPSPNGAVRAIVASGRRVLLGGSFSSVNIVPRDGFAGIDAHGRVMPWHPHVAAKDRAVQYAGSVNVLLASGNTLYVGGGFKRIDGKPRLGLAAFRLPSLRLLPWAPAARGEGMFEGVKALAVGDGVVYVAGDFDSINGAIRHLVGAVDSKSAQTLPWNPPPADVGVPHAVAVADDTVFVGGNPSRGTVALAAVDDEKGKHERWAFRWEGAGVSEVRALVPTANSLYAAGWYLPDEAVARFDRDHGRLLRLSLHVDSRHPIDAMVGSGSNVYVVKAGRVAVVDAESGRLRGWMSACAVSDPEFVPTLAATEKRVIVTCPAAGGSSSGERLVVVPVKNRP